MKGSVMLPRCRKTVWAKLSDPEVLLVRFRECQSFEKRHKNGFPAVAEATVGPVSVAFKGGVGQTDINLLNSHRISGSGEGGTAGFVTRGRFVSTDVAEGFLLIYSISADIGSKLVHRGVAKKMADQRFTNIGKADSNASSA
jgi:carbon monoxide dehydrogenase subunit G